VNDGEQVRRDKRIALRQAASLVDSAGTTYSAMLTDLSSAGFRIECHQLLRIGEYVVVQSGRDRPQRGQIRWADGHMAGGVFLEPVDETLG
jgi:hypothetical protein